MKVLLRALLVVLGLFAAILTNYLSNNPPTALKQHPQVIIALFIIVAGALIIGEVFVETESRRKYRRSAHLMLSLPILRSPLRGRDQELADLQRFIDGPESVLVIEGEPGVGKTSLVSAFLSEHTKQFGFAVWQPLFGAPSSREIVNGWLHLLNEAIPETSIDARINFFLLLIGKLRPKRAVVVFDNTESIFRTSVPNGRAEPSEEFCWLISRLASFTGTRFKVIITSTISVTGDMFQGEPPSIVTMTVKGLDLESLRQIVSDRISVEVPAQHDDVLTLASGNPSAAILLAGLEIRDPAAARDHIEAGRTLKRVVSSHLTALDAQQFAVLGFLSIVRVPMSIQEVQGALASIAPLKVAAHSAIDELVARHLVDEGQDGKVLAGPVVAEVMVETAVAELVLLTMRGNLDTTKLLRLIPLDHVRWPESMRESSRRLVFSVAAQRLVDDWATNVSAFNRETIEQLFDEVARIEPANNLLASNLFSFLLHVGTALDFVVLPGVALVGVDFSRAHLFDVDMMRASLVDCGFADRIGPVYAVKIVDHDRVLVGLASGAVELRTLNTLTTLARREAHSEPVRCLLHATGADWVLTGGEDGRVNLLSADSLDLLASWSLHDSWVWRIIVVSDAQLAVSVASDGSVGVIDLIAREPIGRVAVPSKRLWDACVVGEHIYVTAEDGILWCARTAYLEDAARQGRLIEWTAAANVGDPIKACCEVDDRVLFGCRNGRLFSLDRRSGTVDLVSVEEACIRALSRGSRQSTVISVGDAGIARTYDVNRRELILEKQYHAARTWSIDVAADGLAVTVGDDRSVCTWDDVTGTPVRSVHGYGQTLRSMDWLGRDLIIGCADDFVRKGSITPRGISVVPWQTPRPGRRILGVASLHGGAWVCGFDDGVVSILGSDNSLRSIKAHSYAIESISRSPSGDLLATGGEDRRIQIFDASGRAVTELAPLHSSRIWALDFAPDGIKLVSAGGDIIIAAWNTHTGAILWSGTGHTNLVLAIRWLDDSRVVSAGTDGTMRLWSEGTCRAIVQVGCIIRGLATDGRGTVFGVGRRTESSLGWTVVRWDVESNSLYQKELDVSGGSARTVVYSDGALLIGGDFPRLLVVDATSLNVRYGVRIPGPYSGLKVDATRVSGTDLESVGLLGADISPKSAE